MKSVQFDEYAHQYDALLQENIGFGGKAVAYYAAHKCIVIRNHILGTPLRILDYGCGIGRTIPYLHQSFPEATIWGCDVSEESLAVAASAHPAAHFFLLEGKETERLTSHFDLILIAGVLHHIAPDARAQTLSQVKSLLRPGGELFIFEHNPYNPLTLRAVRTCPWDEGVILLKPAEVRMLLRQVQLKILRARYTLFFPAALKFFQPLEKGLSRIPLGGQFFFHAQH